MFEREFLIEREVVKGSKPASVEYGTPGAREEVRAYGARLINAFKEFRITDLEPYFAGPLSSEFYLDQAKKLDPSFPGASKTISDLELKAKKEAAKNKGKSSERISDEASITKEELSEEIALDKYLEKIAGFNPFGPSASTAWNVLEGYEESLDRLRAKAADLRPLKSTKKQLAPTSIIDTISSAFSTLVVVGGVGLVAYGVVKK